MLYVPLKYLTGAWDNLTVEEDDILPSVVQS